MHPLINFRFCSKHPSYAKAATQRKEQRIDLLRSMIDRLPAEITLQILGRLANLWCSDRPVEFRAGKSLQEFAASLVFPTSLMFPSSKEIADKETSLLTELGPLVEEALLKNIVVQHDLLEESQHDGKMLYIQTPPTLHAHLHHIRHINLHFKFPRCVYPREVWHAQAVLPSLKSELPNLMSLVFSIAVPENFICAGRLPSRRLMYDVDIVAQFIEILKRLDVKERVVTFAEYGAGRSGKEVRSSRAVLVEKTPGLLREEGYIEIARTLVECAKP